jgi:hypothetical protein
VTEPQDVRARRSWVERTFDDQGRGLDRFGLLLLLTVVSVVGLALFDVSGGDTPHTTGQDVGSLLSALIVGLTLVVALRASGLRKRRQRTVDLLIGLVVLGYALSLLGTKTPEGTASPGVSGILVTLSLIAPVVVVLRLLRHREVTSSTILGAISAYLLIAVAFFYLFVTVSRLQAEPFFGTSVPPQGTSTYMYFSLSTITTVGYGDFTAATRVGRLLANAEAVVGQVYLVTFVAFIVSLGATAWRHRRDQQDAAAAQEDQPEG